MADNSTPPPPFIVGMTGGIGCGKTTISDLFAQRGIEVVDTDVIAHQLTCASGKAIPALVDTFGEDILAEDGALDRVVMRQRVFADPTQRQRLEAILHPMIYAEAIAACQHSRKTSPYVLLVVPLLVEAGERYQRHCQRILLIDCAEETQIRRVMDRNHLSRIEVERMLAAQTTRTTRQALATDVVINDGAPSRLSETVSQLDLKFRELAAESHCFS